jgi:hypothetical protein
MFIRYQFYKGFIELAEDYQTLVKLREGIDEDLTAGLLDKALHQRLVRMITTKETKQIKILSI